MLYYANGGPGPATALLRVDAPGDGDHETWRSAPAHCWSVRDGWFPFPNAQLDIGYLGEYFLIDPSEVPEVQQQMRETLPMPPSPISDSSRQRSNAFSTHLAKASAHDSGSCSGTIIYGHQIGSNDRHRRK